jgi:SH3-like domain-containing protein
MFRSGIIFLFCLSSMALLLSPQPAASLPEQNNTRYISDVLKINIKNNIEKPYEVVASVQSGDPVQILQEEGNYLRIETADGKQGWIAKHYVRNDPPRTLLIKQLKQEVADLQGQLSAKLASTAPPAATGETPETAASCPELQQKLSDAEKRITQLLEEQKEQQRLPAEPSSASSAAISAEDLAFIEQFEQTPENYSLLISEYQKRGKQIADLQKTLAKQEDQTRFLWFGAGAAVFLCGLLMGKTTYRKKSKFMY